MMLFGNVMFERPVIDTQVGLSGRGLQSRVQGGEIQTLDASALKWYLKEYIGWLRSHRKRV